MRNKRENDHRFYTIGYEGKTPQLLLEILKQRNVSVLVDIRQNPWSRIRGFSKGALLELLRQNEIEYTHEGALGTPQLIREDYRRTGNVKSALSIYNQHLKKHLDRLKGLKNVADGRLLCFLCMESDWSICHRSVVAREFERISKLRAVHL